MGTITITNPTTAVVEPTPIPNPALSVTGNGEVNVSTNTIVNNGNTPKTVSWSVTNVQNGTLVSVGVETTSMQYLGASGTKVIPVNGSVSFNFFFNVPAGAPGVTNPACTADYTVQWV